MSSTLPITTRPSEFPNTYTGTRTEGIGSVRTLPQERMSTLSSMVRPMPTTATRTIAITKEESRQDALETVRQMVGSTSHTTDGDPSHLVMEDILQDVDHQEEDHLVPLAHLEIWDPLEKEDHQECLDLKEKEDILVSQDLKDHQDPQEE